MGNPPRQLYDWKRFDAAMKERARQLACTDYVRDAGLVPTSVGTHSASFNIRCPAPDHEDRNPSCNIQPDGFRCFACDVYGDIFDLIRLVEGVDYFSDQVRRALSHQGISYDEEREAFLEQESARIKASTKSQRSPSPPKESPGHARDKAATDEPGGGDEDMSEAPHATPADETSAATHNPPVDDTAQTGEDQEGAGALALTGASAVWTYLLDAFTLDAVGIRFLDERQIPAAFARAHGLKSCSYEAWAVRVEGAIKRFGEKACDRAGVLSEKKRAHPYLEHMLLLPSYHEGRLMGLRFRRLSHDVTYGGVKYLSLKGSDNQVEMPFLATHDGLPVGTGPHRGVLYVVEGELDTLSIRSVGRAAIGAPGALTWRPEWVEGWATIPHVVILKDADPEGITAAEKFVGRIHGAASRAHGEAWCEQHLHVFATPSIEGAKDANDLLMISEATLVSTLEAFEEMLS